VCGWRPVAVGSPKPKVAYAVKECAAEGCHTMIRRPLFTDMPAYCKWCQEKLEKQDVPAKTAVPAGDGKEISREEFGMGLYETVKTIGAIMQLRKNHADRHSKERAGPRAVEDWKRKEADLTALLPKQMQALSPEDALEVLERYPWISEL